MSRGYTETRRKAPKNVGDARSEGKAYLHTYEVSCRLCGEGCKVGSVKHLERRLLSVWWYCDNAECENYSPEAGE
jgi:hypothetical protein